MGPLDGAALTLHAGVCTVLTGPSGAGKSLLLRALADLIPHEGRVTLKGEPCGLFDPPRWRKRVRYLSAEPAWWEDRVDGHFESPLRLAEGLSTVGLAPDKATAEVVTLSTGERQRLALLRALDDAPDILLLDEPTAALDLETTRLVEARLGKELKRGAAILLVTHDADQAGRLAHRSLALRHGRILEENSR